jgi:hypothetical protein
MVPTPVPLVPFQQSPENQQHLLCFEQEHRLSNRNGPLTARTRTGHQRAGASDGLQLPTARKVAPNQPAQDAQTGRDREEALSENDHVVASAGYGRVGTKNTQTCHSCGAADMTRQFPRATPRHPKPERAKEQRPAKHAPRAKNHSDTEKPQPKELTGGESAHSQVQRP